ncbi:hypothetical protein AMATHDRAFT_478 [Amanita thiersii Skay4041]|uniref:L-ornithine N(5)-monooxygenase [NAD(P)H] n=1 Tax=Amanita thiersii Skay4041 TaxID=703135 RepID=A0A2A9NT85_9AGAR|nr:hypothetical protein AMATHDRAFT_478 [Amanita thiersii Skay4041]
MAGHSTRSTPTLSKSPMASRDGKRTPLVIIVGAGLAGISTAIALRRQLQFENFIIYEKADDVGGTWRDNTYPGCGSDVPGHWYSLSTDLNPYWSTYYISQPEIQAYWVELWHKYGLKSRTKLGHAVRSAEWDTRRQLYKIQVEKVATGEVFETEAEVMFYAIGGFMSPVYPKDVAGVEVFHGDAWHSARWNHNVDLKGKRVGVIGNGCSAAQFVPEIAAEPSISVVNFVRTPQWYVPRENFKYPRWLQWVFAHVPFVMRCYRNLIMARSDLMFLIFRKSNKRILALTRRMFAAYIKKVAPKDQLEKLIPTYSPGCKRIIVDPGYLKCLHQPNVNLRWEGIDSIVEEGIKLKTGEIVPLDVIIFGTGYSLEPADITIRGRKGKTMREYDNEHGGAAAYAGSCRPGFPNLFTLLGPNVASGHASVIFSEEAQVKKRSGQIRDVLLTVALQINHALQLIKPILDGQAKSFEVKEDVCDEYDGWVQKRLKTSVWMECNSYYQVGGNNETKNVATFPGPVSLFWWLIRTPDWSKFDGVGKEEWERVRRMETLRRVGLVGMGLALAMSMRILGSKFK